MLEVGQLLVGLSLPDPIVIQAPVFAGQREMAPKQKYWFLLHGLHLGSADNYTGKDTYNASAFWMQLGIPAAVDIRDILEPQGIYFLTGKAESSASHLLHKILWWLLRRDSSQSCLQKSFLLKSKQSKQRCFCLRPEEEEPDCNAQAQTLPPLTVPEPHLTFAASAQTPACT